MAADRSIGGRRSSGSGIWLLARRSVQFRGMQKRLGVFCWLFNGHLNSRNVRLEREIQSRRSSARVTC